MKMASSYLSKQIILQIIISILFSLSAYLYLP